jgi:hypothetical protein
VGRVGTARAARSRRCHIWRCWRARASR